MTKTPTEPPPTRGVTRQAERERRRAEALRSNLRRRKTQSRERKAATKNTAPET